MADDPEAADLIAARTTAARDQAQVLRSMIGETREARRLTFEDDEHDPEGSTASLDQVRDSALLAGVEQTLAELDAARGRLETGTYGTCERCGRPIASERLEARPEARTCVFCASRSLDRR